MTTQDSKWESLQESFTSRILVVRILCDECAPSNFIRATVGVGSVKPTLQNNYFSNYLNPLTIKSAKSVFDSVFIVSLTLKT